MHEKGKHFIRGALAGGYTGFVFLLNVKLDWDNIAMMWAVKFFGIIIISFTSAIMTVAGADVYKHKIKDKIFKPKKEEQPNGEQPKDDEKVA